MNQLNTGPNPTAEDSEVGATGLDDSRTICLLHENLLEKIVVKNRMHNGKIKTRIRWRRNLDSLKDFLTLVLRKNGTWIEHTKRTTSHTFKAGEIRTWGFWRSFPPLLHHTSSAHHSHSAPEPLSL